MKRKFRVGDKVRGEKFVYDTVYQIEGEVIAVLPGRIEGEYSVQIAGKKMSRGNTTKGSDYYKPQDLYLIAASPLPEPEPEPPTKPVPELEPQPGCHYCGLKPVGVGFFGEPVCRQCGG